MPIKYREAVKHLRKNEYDRAASVMDEVISADPKHLQHYKFRAEIFRLAGKLKLAIRDYQKITELDPKSAIGFNGLAEVYLQSKDFRRAHDAALQANNLSSNDWVTLYNLGLIEDRLKDSVAAIAHLKQALALNVSDSRHRLLINLYLLRAYGRLERQDEAQDALKALGRDIAGLEEWRTILASDQANTLREVIGDDVQTAFELVNGDLSVTDMRYA
jgi:tetratricopeptide (TPR) repeat protein